VSRLFVVPLLCIQQLRPCNNILVSRLLCSLAPLRAGSLDRARPLVKRQAAPQRIYSEGMLRFGQWYKWARTRRGNTEAVNSFAGCGSEGSRAKNKIGKKKKSETGPKGGPEPRPFADTGKSRGPWQSIGKRMRHPPQLAPSRLTRPYRGPPDRVIF